MKIKKKEEKKDRGGMTDRKKELVPDSWSLVKERVLTTGRSAEGCYSEHPGVCRRMPSIRRIRLRRARIRFCLCPASSGTYDCL